MTSVVLFECDNCGKMAACENSVCNFENCDKQICCSCTYCSEHENFESDDDYEVDTYVMNTNPEELKTKDPNKFKDTINSLIKKNKSLAHFLDDDVNRQVMLLLLSNYDKSDKEKDIVGS